MDGGWHFRDNYPNSVYRTVCIVSLCDSCGYDQSRYGSKSCWMEREQGVDMGYPTVQKCCAKIAVSPDLLQADDTGTISEERGNGG